MNTVYTVLVILIYSWCCSVLYLNLLSVSCMFFLCDFDSVVLCYCHSV